jgi:hypothetical protein
MPCRRKFTRVMFKGRPDVPAAISRWLVHAPSGPPGSTHGHEPKTPTRIPAAGPRLTRHSLQKVAPKSGTRRRAHHRPRWHAGGPAFGGAPIRPLELQPFLGHLEMRYLS